MTSKIQSIIFDRKQYTQRSAEAWLRRHGHRVTWHGKGVDIKPHFLRYRQAKPYKRADGAKYFTKLIAPGIKFVFVKI